MKTSMKKIISLSFGIILILTFFININAETSNYINNEYTMSEPEDINLEDKNTEDIPEIEYKNLSNIEKTVCGFYKSINDKQWEQWASFWSYENREAIRSTIQYSYSKSDVFNIEGVEVISIKSIENSYAPNYRELTEYYKEQENYRCFLVGLNVLAYEESDCYFSGINFDLVVMVKDGDSWYVGGVSSGTPELLQEEGDNFLIQDAIECFRNKLSSLTTQENISKSQTTFAYDPNVILKSNIIEPSSIKVGIGHKNPSDPSKLVFDYIYGEVDFKEFYTNVSQNEFGNMPYGDAASTASTLTVKMCAWYYKYSEYRKQYSVKVIGGFDMAFVPTTTPSDITSMVKKAVQKVYNYCFIYSTNQDSTYNLIPIYYQGGSNSNPSSFRYSGHFTFWGANWLENNSSYTWQQIIHYFFDEANSYGTVTHPITILNTSIPSHTLVFDKVYNIRSVYSGKYLTVQGGSYIPGTTINQYTYNTNAAYQEWLIIDGGNGNVKIKDINSGKLLSIIGSSTSSGTDAWIWHDDGTTGQIFRYRKNTDGTYSFLSKCSDYSYVLDIELSPGDGMNDGNDLQQYYDNVATNQKFILE
ncbi:MAG: hypothetical protein A2Y17_05180 [Clostridiales bacterium GWF2_38_85]|nr:MAG: hypothetical protein A2Y17_05180 [Clostridiales bacterium GWF2_38_85]HBL84824.1 hypothetical protein [Clostridiales bacterium]